MVLGVSMNVLALGLVSLFTDISTEMIVAILPMFLVSELGASAAILGTIEGVSDSTSSLLKVVSGWLSDRTGKRKPLTTLGYGLSTSVKPLIAISNSWPQVLGLRFFDRVGKGIRTAPRDALIADSTSSSRTGRTFGLHRALDTVGAVVGPALAFVLLPVYLYRGVFAWSLVPGLISVAILLFFVQEKSKAPVKELRLDVGMKTFPSKFKKLLLAVLVFGLGNFSNAFFILNTNTLLTPKFGSIAASQITILLYALMNVIYAASSLPIGVLSDRIGKRVLLGVGYFAFGLACFGFMFVTTDIFMIAGLFVLAGFFSASVDTLERAYTADLVQADLRGTGYGTLHTVNGIADLPASIIAGLLWSAISPNVTFMYGGIMAILAVVALAATR
jgi:MFS family permease